MQNFDELYEYLDCVPQGWRDIVKQMINKMIVEFIRLPKEEFEDYIVLQVKEKYYTLRWYDNGHTEEIDKIINEADEKVQRVCIYCGAPATKYTRGYIMGVCDKCYEKHDLRMNYWTAEEFWTDEE